MRDYNSINSFNKQFSDSTANQVEKFFFTSQSQLHDEFDQLQKSIIPNSNHNEIQMPFYQQSANLFNQRNLPKFGAHYPQNSPSDMKSLPRIPYSPSLLLPTRINLQPQQNPFSVSRPSPQQPSLIIPSFSSNLSSPLARKEMRNNDNSRILNSYIHNDNNFTLSIQDNVKFFSNNNKEKDCFKINNINLLTNLYKIEISQDQIYVYKMFISPEILSRKIKRNIFYQLKSILSEITDTSYFAFDGKTTLYSTKKIEMEQDELQLNVAFNISHDQYIPIIAVLKFEQMLSFEEYNINPNLYYTCITDEHLKAIKTILHYEQTYNLLCIGNSFFKSSENKRISYLTSLYLGSSKEIYNGFHFSVHLTENGIMGNIDITDSVFYKNISAIDFFCEITGFDVEIFKDEFCLTDDQIQKLKNEFNKLRIEINRENVIYVYKCSGITKTSAIDTYFNLIGENEEEINISVVEYFWSKYNIPIKYPYLPCVKVRTNSNSLYFPMEFVSIIGNQKCYTDFRTSKIINELVKNAFQRRKAIQNVIEQYMISKDKTSRHFGLTMENSMLKINGSVLPPPKLMFNSNIIVEPENGTWDIKNKEFYTSKDIMNWVLVSFVNETTVNFQQIKNFIAHFKMLASNFGMNINDPSAYYNFSEEKWTNNLFDSLKKNHNFLQFIMIILPTKSTIYNTIKRMGDVSGVVTQCINCNHFKSANASSMSNLLMKLNSKLGGQNFMLSPINSSTILDELVIVIGLDTGFLFTYSHDKPSIASAVGYINSTPNRYFATARFQKSTTKRIYDLGSIIKEILNELVFNSDDHHLIYKASKIIVYRNGLNSKSTFETEIKDIYKACQNISDNFKPTVTYISVQKQHHVKLFSTNSNDIVGNAGNVKPGVIVNRGIAGSNNFDFYMCSHVGIQGTSKPGYYKIITNDSNYSLNQIQLATYQLCYNYVRCSKSISLPSIIFYAQLVIERLRVYVKDPELNLNENNFVPTDENLNYLNEFIPKCSKNFGRMWFA